jgi:uncharacterized protein (DUF952 family)
MTAEPIFHITTREGWATAQRTGEVAPASLAEEGFVHCSTASQLEGSIERHFAGAGELVVLRLHRDRLEDELRWEEARAGERYPHLYRPIALSEVDEARPRPGPPAN